MIVGTLSSYLFGNSVVHFSLTIGLFMSAMGLGSFASRWVQGQVMDRFIQLEIAIGLVGGCSWGFFLAAEHGIVPGELAIGADTQYLNADVWAASQIFDSDIAEVDTEVNTLDSQVVLRYYEQGWKTWR